MTATKKTAAKNPVPGSIPVRVNVSDTSDITWSDELSYWVSTVYRNDHPGKSTKYVAIVVYLDGTIGSFLLQDIKVEV